MRELLPIIMDWMVLFISCGQPLLFIITHYCNNYIMEWALFRSTRIQAHTNCILCHFYTFSDSSIVSGKSLGSWRTVVIILDTEKSLKTGINKFIFAWVFAVLQNPREVSFSLAVAGIDLARTGWRLELAQLGHDSAWCLTAAGWPLLPSSGHTKTQLNICTFIPLSPLHTSVIWATLLLFIKAVLCASHDLFACLK